MLARDFQYELFSKACSKFCHLEIKDEWVSFRGRFYQYSPRVDIAVGPFNIGIGENLTSEYNRLVQDEIIETFLREAFNFHVQNIDCNRYDQIRHPEFITLINKNQNARCLLAIEIENRNSKKHIMGSVINAASLGRVGIGVAYNINVMHTFHRILNYLSFLKSVEKNTYDTTNFLVLTVEQINTLFQNNLIDPQRNT